MLAQPRQSYADRIHMHAIDITKHVAFPHSPFEIIKPHAVYIYILIPYRSISGFVVDGDDGVVIRVTQ